MLGGLRRVAGRIVGAAPRHGGPASRAAGEWFRREEAIMGTRIGVELWCAGRAAAEEAMEAVMQEMHRIDHAMSPHRSESELSRINAHAAAGPVAVSEEMFFLLRRAIDFSRISDGAFDITYASAGQLYDYREQVRPDPRSLAAACAAIGYQWLQLDESARTVHFARPGMRIDLGGFAKGHAVDCAVQQLKARGIVHAYVSAGGDSRVLGDRQGRPWTVGVRDPRRPGALVAVLPLRDVAVSTSGDYERYFEEDGVRYHHILDPRTGDSPHAVHSVTILAPDGLTSEGLSKSVFVLGVERGLRLVEEQRTRLRASGGEIDAVVVDAQGGLHYSQGLRPAAAPASSPANRSADEALV